MSSWSSKFMVETDIDQSGPFTDWYGFDTENDPSGKVTLTALIHENGNHKIWHSAGGFAEWCQQQKGRPIVICHNLEYDLVNEFREDYPWLNLNYLKGRLISAKLGNVTFRDSVNHFKMPLAVLGESMGINKMKMDIHSEEYVTTDAWICVKAMCYARDYIANLNGKIGATSGSSAVSVWRAMTDDEFMFGPIDTPWLRKGYYGGRTEIFRKRSAGDIIGYDVNSMYPFCMLNSFPESLQQDDHMLKQKGMAEITVSIPKSLYVAPLVYRSTEGRLVYPVGTVRGVWSYDEIRYAEDCGCRVHKVHKTMAGSSLCRPFDDFIHVLYNKRKTSKNAAERLMLKVLLNSLYGKVASKGEITRVVSRHHLLKSGSPRIAEVKWINAHRGLLDYYTPQQPYVNVAWGSMITAHARLNLTKYLAIVPPEKLIYCDTDSIYVVNHTMPVSNELGGLKEETVKKDDVMICYQPKVYQYGDTYVAKGVPRAKYNDIGELISDPAREFIENGFTTFQAPIRFRASLNSHRGEANEWVPHTKSMLTTYKHKTLSNGRYHPPVIEEQFEFGF